MPRPLPHLVALALAACAALALTACGGEDAELLPGSTAGEINANLDAVKLLSDEGDCIGAESAAQQVSEQVDALGGIDPKLKQALRDGAARLSEVVDECEEETTEAIAPAEVPPATEEPPEEGDEDGEDEEGEKRSKGKAKGHEKEGRGPPPTAEEKTPATPPTTPPGQVPPAEEESESGGVGPGSPVGESDEEDDD